MVVSWQTLASYSTAPAVTFGIKSDSLTQSASGSTHIFAGVSMHNVVLQNLTANTVYYYSIANDSTNTVYNFTTAPAPGTNAPFSITILGDMGVINAQDTYNKLIQNLGSMDLIIHIGDISYADDYFLRPGYGQYDTFEETWSQWQSWMTPITSTTPYMVLPGNHEYACQLFFSQLSCPTEQQNYLSFRNRFRMPSIESGAGAVENMWSSFDYGLIHFVLIDTESDFTGAPEGGNFSGPGIPTQQAWLMSDLEKANSNRALVPWIVVCGHRPLYTGLSGVSGTDAYVLAVQNAFAPILANYSVDMYLAGHLHMYERLYPIKNSVPTHYSGNMYVDPNATTYIINGAAGNDERHRSAAAGYDSTLTAASNNNDYGYALLTAHNASHLEYQFVISASGAIADDVWVIQTSRAPASPTTPPTTSLPSSSSSTLTSLGFIFFVTALLVSLN